MAAAVEAGDDSVSRIDLAGGIGDHCASSSDQVTCTQSGDAAVPGLSVNSACGCTTRPRTETPFIGADE